MAEVAFAIFRHSPSPIGGLMAEAANHFSVSKALPPMALHGRCTFRRQPPVC